MNTKGSKPAATGAGVETINPDHVLSRLLASR